MTTLRVLDRLDFAILKAILVNNGTPPGIPVLRKSFRSMAKDLGVDQGTIRSRIRKLQEQRVLRGWYLGESPSLTGKDVLYAWLVVDSEAEKDEVIEKLLSVDRVERVCSYLGPKLSLILFHDKSASPDAELRRLGDLVGSETVLHKQAAIQLPAYGLGETDARIVDALRGDPWMPYALVAREVGVSSRTVKRRATRLADDGMIYMLPVIDIKAMHGLVPVELVVEYEPGKRAAANRAISGYLRESLLFSDSAGTAGYFALAVSGIAQMEQVARSVGEVDGVRGVHPGAILDVVLNPNHYEKPTGLTRNVRRDARTDARTKARAQLRA